MDVDDEDTAGILSQNTTGDHSLAGSGMSTPAGRGARTPHFNMTAMTTEYYTERDVNGDDDDEDDSLSFPGSPKAATTPTFNQSYANLKRTLSYKSLREIELKHVQDQLWRRKNETRKRPKDIEQLAIYACSAATRAFLLGFGLRAGVNLVTTLIRLIQRRKLGVQLLLHAIFTKESFRFGGMFGSFVFLWKVALHLLRIYNPGSKGRKRTEGWHAPVAGAISGLAILAESTRNRAGIAQQVFVRGLQGWYNILHARGYVNIPHGDILLFGLSCGQIMYAWLVSPEALNPGYNQWILNASKVPGPVLPWVVARHKRTNEMPPLESAYKILSRRDVTPMNALRIEKLIDDCQKGDYGVAFPPCELVHPWLDSCRVTQLTRWRDVFGWIFPVYAALHFIPPILLKRKQFAKAPLPQLLRSLKGTIRSSAFLSTFVVIFQAQVCFRHQTWGFAQKLPKYLQALWLTKYYYWVMGLSTCLSLFIEDKRRRGELAMYVLPKALESAWSIARRRAYVPFIPAGEVLLSCSALSMAMSTYQHEPDMLSGLVRTILYQLVGLD